MFEVKNQTKADVYIGRGIWIKPEGTISLSDASAKQFMGDRSFTMDLEVGTLSISEVKDSSSPEEEPVAEGSFQENDFSGDEDEDLGD